MMNPSETYVKTVDRTVEAPPFDARLVTRARTVARATANDLRSSMRNVPGWSEWQKNVIRKAIRDLETIR